ncbi:MAG TPA: ATP-binding protein, partial [Chitinophagaceae bacterium]|nr:ATP-binding protein [Chitinophagaceae bacterium]
GKTISPDGVHTYKLQRSRFIDRGFARSFIMMEELTTEILAAEKKAYGKVIRMMAHEVNNTIGPVNSIIESALQTKNLWTRAHETLEHALQVAHERNGNLNIFMRNFANVVRLPPPDKERIDLNRSLETVVTLFGYKAQEAGIELLFDKPADPLMIDADRQQLEQALINIIKNAMEAIEGNGKIVIVSSPLARQLTITDSGTGISGEHSEHLFSPFFSTKKNGQGVGLTLVKEILLNHGFPFFLKTIEANKTVFSIQFDAAAR